MNDFLDSNFNWDSDLTGVHIDQWIQFENQKFKDMEDSERSLIDSAETENRLLICNGCEYLRTDINQCTISDRLVTVATLMPSSECPDGRWNSLLTLESAENDSDDSEIITVVPFDSDTYYSQLHPQLRSQE